MLFTQIINNGEINAQIRYMPIYTNTWTYCYILDTQQDILLCILILFYSKIKYECIYMSLVFIDMFFPSFTVFYNVQLVI